MSLVIHSTFIEMSDEIYEFAIYNVESLIDLLVEYGNGLNKDVPRNDAMKKNDCL